jgi:hypothetical protein
LLRVPSRLIALAALAAAPALAQAQPGMVLVDPQACDGAEQPDATMVELARLDADLSAKLGDYDLVFNRDLIDRIVRSAGDAVRALPQPKTGPAVVADAFQVRPPASVLAMPTLTARLHPRFGDGGTMAVSVNPHLDQSGALDTDIHLRHSDALVDAGFNLATQQSLIAADPMALRYDGQALVRFGPAVQMGLAAKGTLGTLAAPTLSGNETAGPLLHIGLIDSRLSLVSDLGYDFGLNPLSALSRTQFHAKLDLKLKL